MMNTKLRVAINGFGRIGKAISRILIEQKHANLELVAINDHSPATKLVEALQLDTNYGGIKKPIQVVGKKIKVEDQTINTYMFDRPEDIPWRKEKVDVVVESTGAFTKVSEAKRHLKAGAKQVLLSAYPSAGAARVLVTGASDLTKTSDKLLSHASCTATCVSPVMRLLTSKFPVQNSSLIAIESVTHSSQTVDKTSGRGRRRRSAMVNIIPIEIEADQAVPQIVGRLNNKFMAQGVRVPTPVVHLAILHLVFKKKITVPQINNVFVHAAEKGPLKGIIGVTDLPVASQDMKQRPESAIIDLSLTKVIGNLAQVFAWYDNEWGFSMRVVDLLNKIATNR